MPRSVLNEILPGVQSFGRAVGAGPGIKAQSSRSGFAQLGNADYLQSRAELARAQTAKLQAGNVPEDPNDLADAVAYTLNIPIGQARQWFNQTRAGGGPDPANPQEGDLSPEMSQALGQGIGDILTQRKLTGKTNFNNLQTGKKTRVQASALETALDDAVNGGGDSTSFAKEATIGGVHPMAPYSTNAQGTVLDRMTGNLDESSLLADASRDAVDALSEQRGAAADKYDAQADAADKKQTGKAQLDPAEIRTFNAYARIFPNKTPEEVLSIVKQRRTEDPNTSRDKTVREIMKAHPRWGADQVNLLADQLEQGRRKPSGGPAAAPLPTAADVMPGIHRNAYERPPMPTKPGYDYRWDDERGVWQRQKKGS